jgi:hypothetical protein
LHFFPAFAILSNANSTASLISVSYGSRPRSIAYTWSN